MIANDGNIMEHAVPFPNPQSADLPTQADAIAKAVCGGYTEVVVEYEDPPAAGERVAGFVNIAGTPIGLPYTFTAP